MKNPETGKFCRGCGIDLATISGALSERSNLERAFDGAVNHINHAALTSTKGKTPGWESAFSTLFMGFAFLVISIILGVTGLASASKWWFWLLIPAFAMLGTGFARVIQLKKNERAFLPVAQPETAQSFKQTSNVRLPPAQTEYVAPETRYKTGELVPPSVIEGTTRHLEINTEGETMTLPKK